MVLPAAQLVQLVRGEGVRTMHNALKGRGWSTGRGQGGAWREGEGGVVTERGFFEGGKGDGVRPDIEKVHVCILRRLLFLYSWRVGPVRSHSIDPVS